MFDCSKTVLGFHNDEVTLRDKERKEMKGRRDANRKRIRKNLSDSEKPKPLGFQTQGSYAMRTMVQEADKDYDIDDGIYFKEDDLVGPQGGKMTPLQVRQMVCDAATDQSFTTPPKTMKNCVRVFYDDGSHVDIPSYREVKTSIFWDNEKTNYELASSEWKESDPLAVTEWFLKENNDKSTDRTNGGQLRRVVRSLKKFARSRESWKSRNASGFMISKLVTECFKANASREDEALKNTMRAISSRLDWDLLIKHPILDEYLTNGDEDPRVIFFQSKLNEALSKLEALDDSSCTEEEAAKSWDSVFATDYFSSKAAGKKSSGSSGGATNAGILLGGLGSRKPKATDKDGGGRYG